MPEGYGPPQRRRGNFSTGIEISMMSLMAPSLFSAILRQRFVGILKYGYK